MQSHNKRPRITKLKDRLKELAHPELPELRSPLSRLDRFARHCGGSEIFMKRDDIGLLGGGGNKLRKLRYLFEDARKARASTVISSGALQSNHARLTAAVAAKLGLRCVLVLGKKVIRTQEEYLRGGNLILDNLFNADIRILEREADLAAVAENIALEYSAKKDKAYVIPFGGSNWLGALGYVDMVFELADQLDLSSDVTIVCTCGSGGMMAGIVSGVSLLRSKWRVLGISVLDNAERMSGRVNALCSEVHTRLGETMSEVEWIILDDWIGGGYGVLGAETAVAIKEFAMLEGVPLDPVYTGKTVQGLKAYLLGATPLQMRGTAIFVHSGGLPGVFAYPEMALV